jgi:hypothetical protein
MPAIWANFHYELLGITVANDSSTNAVESFNSHLSKEKKYLPVGLLMPEVVMKALKRFQAVRAEVQEHILKQKEHALFEDVYLESDIVKYMKACRHEASKWELIPCSVVKNCQNKVNSYNVKEYEGTTKHSVNLESRSCSCGLWQRNQFPCTHAYKAVEHQFSKFRELIWDCLCMEEFLKVTIPPIRHSTAELKDLITPNSTLLYSPPKNPKPGRKPRNRKKSGFEKYFR